MSPEEQIANSMQGEVGSPVLKPRSSFDRSPSQISEAVLEPEMAQASVQENIEPAMQIVRSGNNLYRTSDGATRSTADGPLTHLASGGVVNGLSWVAEYNEYEPYLSPTLDELTLEDKSIRDNFWERGQFVYGNKVQASFL